VTNVGVRRILMGCCKCDDALARDLNRHARWRLRGTARISHLHSPMVCRYQAETVHRRRMRRPSGGTHMSSSRPEPDPPGANDLPSMPARAGYRH
jgi:hypothetical protein